MGLGLATKAFFKILFDGKAGRAYEAAVAGKGLPAPEPEKAKGQPAAAAAPKKPQRSEAISLLAALQRESRLVDLLQESLDDYDDAQVGAAARDVLRDARKVLDRMFALAPITEVGEGESLQTPAEVDAGRFKLTGSVSGNAPFQGAVAHHGWEATKCEVPSWSGSEASAKVVAPIELEIG